MHHSIVSSYRFGGLYKSLLYLYLIGLSEALSAMELVIDESSPNASQNIHMKVEKKVYPRATQDSIVCGKSHHIARFRLNSQHAGLAVSLISRDVTRVKIRWDHSDKVSFPFPSEKKTITFSLPGSESRLYFRAYEPVSGNLYVMDEEDVVVKVCPYSFLPAKRYRQAINVNVSETEYDRASDVLDDQSGSISVKYRVSSRTTVPDGATWSWSVGVSQSDRSTDSQRINSNFSFNW